MPDTTCSGDSAARTPFYWKNDSLDIARNRLAAERSGEQVLTKTLERLISLTVSGERPCWIGPCGMAAELFWLLDYEHLDKGLSDAVPSTHRIFWRCEGQMVR
jgi:hypothetical protein